MNTVVFTAPDGKEKVNPTIEGLTELIQRGGDDFWAEGSSDAGLRFIKNDVIFAEMILMVRQPYGVFVHHLYNDDGREYVINNPTSETDEVTVTHAGNQWCLPKAFFVGEDQAIIAIHQFLKDGCRAEGVRWTEF